MNNSLLLIKTQMALDHKEKETMALKYEMEEINVVKKESVTVNQKRKQEDMQILLNEKDKMIQD